MGFHLRIRVSYSPGGAIGWQSSYIEESAKLVFRNSAVSMLHATGQTRKANGVRACRSSSNEANGSSCRICLRIFNRASSAVPHRCSAVLSSSHKTVPFWSCITHTRCQQQQQQQHWHSTSLSSSWFKSAISLAVASCTLFCRASLVSLAVDGLLSSLQRHLLAK